MTLHDLAMEFSYSPHLRVGVCLSDLVRGLMLILSLR